MKKRFLPFSLLLVIMILGQSVIAGQGGHYVPRTQPTMNSESFMGSLRVNQKTGLIDPVDMFKAMQAPVMSDRAEDALYWINMGPDNMGGQTTAILYDNTLNASNNPNGVVYIGSKGGGVYKTYNQGITWHQVGNVDLMVSTMAQDKDGVIYVGTGDCGTISKFGNNTYDYNGLSQQGYTNSFIGTGIWTIDARNNDAMTQIVAPTADEWLYINELAVVGNKLLVATPEGLKYTSNKGQSWHTVLEGNAAQVKVGSGNVIVASVDGKIYIGDDINNLVCHSGETTQMEGDTLLPLAAAILDIAVSPKNDNVIYASSIDAQGNHAGVFMTSDKGATWSRILPNVGSNLGHNIYEGRGVYNHGIVVDPSDDGILYVTGYKLWRLQRPSNGSGYYLCEAVTLNSMISSPAYLHVGLHVMTFNPNNPNEYYIGTDGGLYKGDRDFMFFNCNRNYVTMRAFSVAYSGKDTRVMASGLDHGTVLIEGDENTNTLGTGLWINPSGDNMGMYSDGSDAGSCAFSMINSNTIFVTYKGSDGHPVIARSETAGEDWVSTNFTSGLSVNGSSYRLPFVMTEEYDATWNIDSVWYYNTTEEVEPAGKVVECISNNNYPFNFTLTAPVPAGDSVLVHDPIAAKLFVSFTDALYLSLTPLNFGVESEWIRIAGKLSNSMINQHPELASYSYTGEPLSMGLSADGDNLFVGFKNGKLYRITHLNTVSNLATGVNTVTVTDSLGHASTIMNPDCQVVTTTVELPIDGQCITSVSFDPRNSNKVVITCGNYGNESYVFYSTNALSDNPVFTSVQGNLPQMPVYSSLIEMGTGDVIIGTERGIFRTKDIASANWTAESRMLGEVPVMELKQQRMSKEDKQIVEVTEDGTFITDYPGVHNTGIIYAATYGKGVFRCENYKVSGTSVPETPAAVETSVMLYPNPVQGEATVSFEMTESANVNYQVFDLTGRMVMSQSVGRMTEGSHEFRINTENLSTGSYVLRLNQGGNSSCVKFLVY